MQQLPLTPIDTQLRGIDAKQVDLNLATQDQRKRTGAS
jgi:hypothetical protein